MKKTYLITTKESFFSINAYSLRGAIYAARSFIRQINKSEKTKDVFVSARLKK